MADKIQIRRDISTNWTSVNPVVASGEICFETDTLKLKIGNGVTAWNSLAYTANINVIDNLISTASNNPLSANQGKVLNTALTSHTSDTENPHSVTKAQVELGNVDNTSDVNKPVSTAQATAIGLKANNSEVVHKTGDETIAGVKTFSSSPIVPSPTTSFQVATKKYVDDKVGIIEWSGTDGVVGGQDYYAGISYVGYGGDIYVALLNSGGSIEARVPTNATYWKKVSSAGIDINGQTNKTTPISTDNFILQEVGGLLKKLSWSNLITTVMNILNFPAGTLIQVANYTTGTVSTGTTIIPNDNTVPQITEGTQFMSLAFTPKKANSKLKISVTTHVSSSAGTAVHTTSLFDGTTNALSSSQQWNANSASIMCTSFVTFYNVSSLSPITFSVRCGMDKAGTITFNGAGGAQLMGGSLASSITIEEIAQ